MIHDMCTHNFHSGHAQDAVDANVGTDIEFLVNLLLIK